MEIKYTIERISNDSTSLWLSNHRTFIVDSAYLGEVKLWKEGDKVSVKEIPSDSPYCYKIKNGSSSILAGTPND